MLHFVKQGLSIAEARQRVFETETEVFKLVLEGKVVFRFERDTGGWLEANVTHSILCLHALLFSISDCVGRCLQ